VLPYLDPHIPLVFIYNNIEVFFEFLHRAERSAFSRRTFAPYRQYSKGDRALLSLGAHKLVFASAPIPHADDVRERLGFTGTDHAAPANPSPWLCLDILHEPPLLRKLVAHAGERRALHLVPYAATPQFYQLVEVLRNEHGLNVLLPESPAPENLWLRDYVDTKSGFRSLAARWLPEAEALLPEGVVCPDAARAAAAARWFLGRGRSCVIKSDGGESGIGQHVFHPGQPRAAEAILDELRADAYLDGDLIVVEDYIHSTRSLSPSLEVYVPPPERGAPRITYLSNQLFLGVSDFYGLLISRELTETPWYSALAENGLRLAHKLQALGYVGHFDIDTIVGDDERVYLLELNSRRTAGTHVHEFGHFAFGPDYLDHVALLSINKMKTGALARYDDLRAAIGEWLYPMRGQRRGLIPAVTSILPASEFGCIIVAPSSAEALELHRALVERLHG
jgi:hypothetical protein